MTTWTVDVHLRNVETAYVSDIPIKTAVPNWVLNAPGACEFTCNLQDVAVATLEPGQREIYLKRDGVRVWGGKLLMASVDVLAYEGRFFAEGTFSDLRPRYVQDDLIFHPENVHQIMWELIDHTQGQTQGDLGITQGSHAGGSTAVNRDYCEKDHDNIADAIDELTGIDDGVDWVITPTPTIAAIKEFRTYNPRRGSDVSGDVIFDGDNSMGLTYDYDAKAVANYVETEGPGQCSPSTYVRTDVGSQSLFGRMELYEQLDQGDQRDLQHHTNEILRVNRKARLTARVTYSDQHAPDWGSFDVGDIVRLVADRGYTDLDQNMRVVEFECNIDAGAKDETFYVVTLDGAIDENLAEIPESEELDPPPDTDEDLLLHLDET